jgi:hypothetical protein
VLQGVAGGVFPLAFGIVRDTFPRDQVPGGLAIVSAIFGIGGGIGLPLSGVIVDNLPLAWLFWVSSVIALPVAFAAPRLVPPSPPVEPARSYAASRAAGGSTVRQDGGGAAVARSLHDELVPLALWRYDQLMQLGVEPLVAAAAALAGVDASGVRSLVESGCPPLVALRILTPV